MEYQIKYRLINMDLKKSNHKAIKWSYIQIVGLAPHLCLLLVSAIFYGSYFRMESAPPWDFWGGYTTDAGYWWANFNLLKPLDYFPSQFFGFPAYTQPQSSAWYFPVGVIYLFFQEFGPKQAAFLQALTIFFGACGVYKLANKLGIRKAISFIGAVAFLFAPGFVANAQHTDIVRGWAFLPWILVLLMGGKASRTALVLATLFWFTFFVGIYPGQIISFAYIGGLWFFLQIKNKFLRSNDLVFVIIPILSGLLFSLVKWIPYLATVGPSENFVSAEKINFDSILTLIYPFRDPLFLGDISMRSYFMVPILTLFAVFAIFQKNSINFFFVIVLSIFGSLSNDYLPLASNSRFPASDFKAGITLSILMLGLIGMNRFLNVSTTLRLPNSNTLLTRNLIFIPVAFTFFMLVYAEKKGVESANFLIGSGGITLACLLLIFTINTLTSDGLLSAQVNIKKFILCMVLISVILSGFFSLRTAPTWNANIAIVESVLWGDEAKSYRYDQASLEMRPRRVGPDFPVEAGNLLSVNWNVAKLKNQYSSGGYITYKRQERLMQILNSSNVEKDSFGLNLLKDVSTGWFIPSNQDSDLQAGKCIRSGTCVSGNVTFQEWSPNSIKMQVNSEKNAKLVINEVSYLGWHAETCTGDGICSSRAVPSNEINFYLSSEIDSSIKYVHLYFKTPFSGYVSAGFILGLSIMILPLYVLRRRNEIKPGSLV